MCVGSGLRLFFLQQPRACCPLGLCASGPQPVTVCQSLQSKWQGLGEHGISSVVVLRRSPGLWNLGATRGLLGGWKPYVGWFRVPPQSIGPGSPSDWSQQHNQSVQNSRIPPPGAPARDPGGCGNALLANALLADAAPVEKLYLRRCSRPCAFLPVRDCCYASRHLPCGPPGRSWASVSEQSWSRGQGPCER